MWSQIKVVNVSCLVTDMMGHSVSCPLLDDQTLGILAIDHTYNFPYKQSSCDLHVQILVFNATVHL